MAKGIDEVLARIKSSEEEKTLQDLVEAKKAEINSRPSEIDDLPPIPDRGSRTEKDAERIAARAKRKAELIQVLSRGEVNHNIKEILAKYSNETYEAILIEDTPQEINRARALNAIPAFDNDQVSIHGTGDGMVRIGDLVVFLANRQDKEIMQEILNDETARKSGLPRQKYIDETQDDKRYVTTYDNTRREIKHGGA